MRARHEAPHTSRSETKRRNDGDDDEPLDGGEDDVRDPDLRRLSKHKRRMRCANEDVVTA